VTVVLTVVLTVVVTALVVLGIAVLASRPSTSPPPPAPLVPPTTGPVTPVPTAPASPTPPQASTAPSTPPPGPTNTAAPTAPTAPADAATAVWPAATSAIRYATPERAVRGFATELVGFRAPLLGPYQAGDRNSGEIEVRPRDPGPVTTVFVRRLGDGNWWVLGAATADVRLDSPTTGETISSPVTLTGEARAFEGHVTVRITEDGTSRPLVTGFVTGGGDLPRPFTGAFAFPAPGSGYGSIVLTTESARDGSVSSASVQRIRFGSAR
jgi:hypothetical protein